MTNKNFHEKRFCYCYIVISVMLKPLKQCLIEVTSFRHSKLLYSWSVLFNIINNSVAVFPYHLDHRIYETKFLTHVSFLFSIFYCIILNFSLTLRTSFFVTIAMLSLYPSLVYCRSRKVDSNFMHKVNYHWDLHSSGVLCSIDW
jgi:hypothetical protein